MSEIDQLKKRIDDSGVDGIKTAHIRDDYEPIGDVMIRDLVSSGEYITCEVSSSHDRKPRIDDQNWKIFKASCKPY